MSVMADQIAELVEAASQEVHATDEEKEAEVEAMKKKAAEAKAKREAERKKEGKCLFSQYML